MSAAGQTKIFGIRLGLDPKLLVGALIVVAGFLYWYNSRTGETAVSTAPVSRPPDAAATENATAGVHKALPSRRARSASADRGVLRLIPIDATRGDVDPTLRLDLLTRLQAVEEGKIGRSVFESESAAAAEAASLAAIHAPKIPVKPAYPPVTPPTATPTVNVPLKYYGYAKPQEKSEANRGLFLDGDNVLVAVEGQVVKGHYLVVELTPNSARMEDTQLHMGQTLPVVPQAVSQQ